MKIKEDWMAISASLFDWIHSHVVILLKISSITWEESTRKVSVISKWKLCCFWPLLNVQVFELVWFVLSLLIVWRCFLLSCFDYREIRLPPVMNNLISTWRITGGFLLIWLRRIPALLKRWHGRVFFKTYKESKVTNISLISYLFTITKQILNLEHCVVQLNNSLIENYR